MQSSANMYLANLAVADLIHVTFGVTSNFVDNSVPLTNCFLNDVICKLLMQYFETSNIHTYTSLQKNSKYAVFRSPFSTIFLAMCNIRKCSEKFIVFNGANSFPIEKF